MTNVNLTKRIMRRVYFVYLLRQLFSPLLVKLYIILALLWQASRYVSWSNVFENMSGKLELSNLYTFTSSAFINTEATVQLTSTAVVVLIAWAIYGSMHKHIGVQQAM